jgi:CubicO group peptidase (beta-lactamase class C family)
MMSVRIVVVAACAIAAACSAPPGGPGVDRAFDSRVDELFRRHISPATPGCAVGVYRDGVVVLARGYGVSSVDDPRPITPRTNFNLGSQSKPFTTLAVLQLEQRGKLSLADDVRRWIPELPDYGRPIRVQDLLQHTSGFRDFQTLELLSGQPVSTMAEFLALMARQRALNLAPGAQSEYSHTDYGILGLVVERVAGEPFGQFLEREIFAPMGMPRTVVHDGRGPQIALRAAGHERPTKATAPTVSASTSRTFGGDNVYSSIEDLAGWDRSFTHPTAGGAAAIARMVSRPVLPNGETIPYAYGIRLGAYRGLRTVSRGGHAPGSWTEMIRFPDQHLAVAVLCNADDLDAPRFARSVADLYLAAEMSPLPPKPVAPSPVAVPQAELLRYAGTYAPADDPWNHGPIEVRNGVLGEVLFHDTADEEFFPMTPAGRGRFFEIGRTGNVGVFTFTPASGVPSRLEISWNDGLADTLERVPDAALWRPSANTLAAYAGQWSNVDLDVVWSLEVRGDRLVLHRKGFSPVTLRPIVPDRFLRGIGQDGETSVRFEFERDGSGRRTGLTVSTPAGEDSVRNLRFVRVAPRGVEVIVPQPARYGR